ncbi:MAG: glycerol-3-phosphate 1-O-acyltransferase PlsY [Flavobacteriales bacterium]|nr:glycerol-3-phosphate 1-O-acyltransferase PlsY [Flavobacteriales bacterium]
MLVTNYYIYIYLLLAYLIGAISSSIWLGKVFFKKDVRTIGSGNAGATNTFRVFGKAAGIIVLLIDIGKGTLAVLLPVIFTRIFSLDLIPRIAFLDNYQLLLGLGAALGHIYPIYEKFKGGKGVATLFGVILGIDPAIAGICVATFMLVFVITRKVSAGSLVASIAFTVAFIIIHNPWQFIDNLLVLIYPILVFYTHRSNIKRLIKGEEPDFTISKR